jgi:hypothetical protein
MQSHPSQFCSMHYGHNLVAADFEASGLISIYLLLILPLRCLHHVLELEMLREKVGKGRTTVSFSVLLYALWA